MAIKTIFTDDKENGTDDELGVFADNEGYLTIMMYDPQNDYSFCKIQLNEESAILLLNLLTKEIGLM